MNYKDLPENQGDFKIFEKECLSLVPKGESESCLKTALDQLDEIQPSRSTTERSVLKDIVTDLCFIAFRENKSGKKDFSEDSRNKHKALLKEIPIQLKAIKTLKNFSNEFNEAEKNISVLGDEITVKTLDKSQKTLEGILNNEHPLILSMQRFLLSYPNPIVKQQETEAPEVNWLLFALVFLIRKFSDPNLKNGEWAEKLSGEMPPADEPYHYSIVSDIVNAVIKPHGTAKNQFALHDGFYFILL